MPARFKINRIKANKVYRVAELAEVACVCDATVRNWLEHGMQRVDHNRPTMILGFQALSYLKARKSKAKRPLALGEFYCLRCKVPRMPLGAMADYQPTSQTAGRLEALCDVCGCFCNRSVRASDLPEISKVLDLKIRSIR